MSIIASNFTKILAERKQGQISRSKIRSGTAIKEIKEVSLGKQKALHFTYVNEIAYDPNFGRIVLEGEVIVLSDEKEAKATIESFNKTKRFAAPLMEKVYNSIIQKTSIQALILARDMGLPSPVRLPRVSSQEQKSAEQPASASNANDKNAKPSTTPSKSAGKPKKK